MGFNKKNKYFFININNKMIIYYYFIISWRCQNYSLAQDRIHAIKAKLIAVFKGKHFAMTADAWTSITKTGYTTCTIIDQDTWKLHSMVLGLYEKTGRSRAQDCVGYAEQQMDDYGLTYRNITAVVTDIEATMVAAGRLFVV